MNNITFEKSDLYKPERIPDFTIKIPLADRFYWHFFVKEQIVITSMNEQYDGAPNEQIWRCAVWLIISESDRNRCKLGPNDVIDISKPYDQYCQNADSICDEEQEMSYMDYVAKLKYDAWLMDKAIEKALLSDD